jgi:hypothetical protein
MSIEAMKMALKVLHDTKINYSLCLNFPEFTKPMDALRQAIAEAEKESTLQEISNIGQALDGLAETSREIEQTPDDLLRQSEREGWRYAKECEAEIKRFKELAEYRLQLLMKMPKQKKWVGLTDEEIAQTVGSPLDEVYLADFRRVEAKLREKNT